jgi:hypothetical protein
MGSSRFRIILVHESENPSFNQFSILLSKIVYWLDRRTFCSFLEIYLNQDRMLTVRLGYCSCLTFHHMRVTSNPAFNVSCSHCFF